MLQKVAAMVDKFAADLLFRVSKVRLLLSEKYFEIAATSAAIFCASIYYSNAVFSALCYFCAEDLRKRRVKWYIQHAGSVVFTKLPA